MPDCVYCGDEYESNGHKKHERHCDARPERFQGTPVGLENWLDEQASLGSFFSTGQARALTTDEKERMAEQIHDKRRKTS